MLNEDIKKEVDRRKCFYLNEDKRLVFEKYKDKYSMIANRIDSIILDSLDRINNSYKEAERQKVYNYIESLLTNFAKMYCEEYNIDFEIDESGQVIIAKSFVYSKMWIDIYELYEFLERVRLLIETNEIENTKHR